MVGFLLDARPSTISLIWMILYPIILVSFGSVFVQAFRGKVPRRVSSCCGKYGGGGPAEPIVVRAGGRLRGRRAERRGATPVVTTGANDGGNASDYTNEW